jgi:DNA-binding CsgD family transcriptional regulator
MKPRALTDERAKRVRREYYLGRINRPSRIAEREGISVSTVLAYAKRQHKTPA